MREPLRDQDRLIHIKETIQKIEAGIKDNIESLTENSLEYFGIVKLIEIIGEAVYMLSKDFKDSHDQTPWRQIERMRHVLVHGYYTIGIDFIKEVIKTDLPKLKDQIESYLQ